MIRAHCPTSRSILGLTTPIVPAKRKVVSHPVTVRTSIRIARAACRGALGQFIARLLEKHLTDCVSTCMEGDHGEITERVSKAIAAAMRLST